MSNSFDMESRTPSRRGYSSSQSAVLDTLHRVEKTHICHFYENRQDLVDILVPFFKEGLEKGEFCAWAATDPLDVDDARAELARVVPDVDTYIKKGQLLIVPTTQIYGKDFDARYSFEQFLAVVKDALRRGYTGIRCDGNTGGVPSRDWLNLMVYEGQVDVGLRNFSLTAMCSYPLSQCSETEIAAVRKHHQSTLVKRGTAWEFIPGRESRIW